MPDFYGVIKNGSIKLDKREAFSALLHSLEGELVTISLDKRLSLKDMGTDQLRKYFHKVVVPAITKASCSAPTTENHEHTKRALKELFLTVPHAPGEPIEVRGTSSLTKSEYAEFIFHCRQYAAETYHLDIEDPK